MFVMDNTDGTECSLCAGSGGFDTLGPSCCAACNGTGVRACCFCRRLPGVHEAGDGLLCCGECLPLSQEATRCACGGDPIAMYRCVAVCGACLDAARHAPATVVPPAADTIPAPANDSGGIELVDDDEELRVGLLMQSALLIEDARAVGVPVDEAFRIIRNAGGGR